MLYANNKNGQSIFVPQIKKNHFSAKRAYVGVERIARGNLPHIGRFTKKFPAPCYPSALDFSRFARLNLFDND